MDEIYVDDITNALESSYIDEFELFAHMQIFLCNNELIRVYNIGGILVVNRDHEYKLLAAKRLGYTHIYANIQFVE